MPFILHRRPQASFMSNRARSKGLFASEKSAAKAVRSVSVVLSCSNSHERPNRVRNQATARRAPWREHQDDQFMDGVPAHPVLQDHGKSDPVCAARGRCRTRQIHGGEKRAMNDPDKRESAAGASLPGALAKTASPTTATASPIGSRVKLPPHSIEAEEYLLSCCLLDGDETIAKCINAKLPGAAFYSPANRLTSRFGRSPLRES